VLDSSLSAFDHLGHLVGGAARKTYLPAYLQTGTNEPVGIAMIEMPATDPSRERRSHS
jgi:hypothetical protein